MKPAFGKLFSPPQSITENLFCKLCFAIPSVVIVLLMGISRNYLMAHYPSDVLFAAVIGVFSGFVAWFITQFIFNFLRRRRRSVPVFATILDFDVRDYLPFELPSLPVKKGGVKSAFAGKRESRSARRTAPADEVPEEIGRAHV